MQETDRLALEGVKAIMCPEGIAGRGNSWPYSALGMSRYADLEAPLTAIARSARDPDEEEEEEEDLDFFADDEDEEDDLDEDDDFDDELDEEEEEEEEEVDDEEL